MGEEKYLCSMVENKYLSMNEPEEIPIHLFDMYIKELSSQIKFVFPTYYRERMRST